MNDLPTTMPGLLPALARIAFITVALLKLGTALAIDLPPPVDAYGLPHWQQIAAGGWHTCAITPAKVAYCWGRNIAGQLGDATIVNRNRPTRVIGGLRFKMIGAGISHSCALDLTGAAICWGSNSVQQLGNASLGPSSEYPALVEGGQRFATISVGANHNCGLDSTGLAFCWGGGASGELGHGKIANESTPVAVSGGLHFLSISAGHSFTCGVTTITFAAYCWGSNNAAQLGIGAFGAGSLVPVPVVMGTWLQFTQISAGVNHTCARAMGGALYCWGAGSQGQIGDVWQVDRTTPSEVYSSSSTRYKSVDAGSEFACGVLQDARTWCWGRNDLGQLGIGQPLRNAAYPTAVISQFGLVLSLASVSAGSEHACGVSPFGEGFCWGRGSNGQLGIGTWASSIIAVAVLRPQ